MSRDLNDVISQYTGTGDLTDYSFDFLITAKEQVQVVILDDEGVETNRVYGDDTSVVTDVIFDPLKGGGNIVLASVLPDDYRLLILLAPDEPVQKSKFSNKSSFTLRSFEAALDELSGQIQRAFYRLKGMFTIHEIDIQNGFDPRLPPGIADNAGRVFKVSNDGTKFDYGPTTDTINGASEAAATAVGAAAQAQDILADIEAAAAQLPTTPGAIGDVLETEDDGTGLPRVAWKTALFQGFSSRYNANVDLEGVSETLAYIMQLTFAGPLVSLGASGSGTLREKGASVASTTLTATTTKRTDPLAKIEFRKNGVLISTTDPVANPLGGSEVYNYTTPAFTDNTSFSARIFDDGSSNGGTQQFSDSTVNFNFVYPYYSGVGLPARTAAEVAAMTKDIRVSTSMLNKVFVATAGDVYYFAYPASYGALTSILDENGFETFNDWTLRTENITGLDASAVSYRIYEFENVSAGGTTNYTFIR